MAVPDFVALTPDAAEAARTIGQVLWDDLNFEREFYLIARDTYATIPAVQTIEQIPFPSWRELGADALVFGTVQRTGDTLRVQFRLIDVATGRTALAKEYSGSATNPVSTHTPRRTTSTCSSARCREWRGPSWRSCPIARTNGRRASTSRRCSSRITTAPISSGSPTRAT
jgi:TolB-like protein